MNAYKFAFHANVPAQPPETENTKLLDKAFGDEPLTREEKDRIAQVLYGIFGANGPSYRLSGWCWPMSQAKQVKRILVSNRHEPDRFRAYYAPDKSSLRKAIKVDSPKEMIYA